MADKSLSPKSIKIVPNSNSSNLEKNIKKIKDKNVPILVLGPCLNHDYSGGEEEISLNNYINNIEIGYAAT